MTIRFYLKDGRWFADLPEYIAQGGTEDECEMVSGADTWLDYLYLSTEDFHEIWIDISETPLANKLTKYHDDEYGATYMAHEYDGEIINHQLWLCPVTKFLFDKFPEEIFYEINYDNI